MVSLNWVWLPCIWLEICPRSKVLSEFQDIVEHTKPNIKLYFVYLLRIEMVIIRFSVTWNVLPKSISSTSISLWKCGCYKNVDYICGRCVLNCISPAIFIALLCLSSRTLLFGLQKGMVTLSFLSEQRGIECIGSQRCPNTCPSQFWSL